MIHNINITFDLYVEDLEHPDLQGFLQDSLESNAVSDWDSVVESLTSTLDQITRMKKEAFDSDRGTDLMTLDRDNEKLTEALKLLGELQGTVTKAGLSLV